MGFDALVTNPGRLRILTALASADDRQSFVEVRRRTGLTDGNLATHARRLQSVGFIAIEKTITQGKPLTTLQLTRSGRDALMEHAQNVLVADGDFEWDDLGSWTALARHQKADPEGNCAVADFVLYPLVQLSKGLTKSVGYKERIITKTSRASRLSQYSPAANAVGETQHFSIR